MTAKQKVENALGMARKYAGSDGAHHKQYCIDQMVRALTGCPMVTETAKNYKGEVYEYETQGESPAYKKFIRDYQAGEDGPNTYSWDEGC
jgi:hypothetical protein